MCYHNYLLDIDSSVYKFIGENNGVLYRCRRVSDDTMFILEYSKRLKVADLIVIKSTSITRILNGKYEGAKLLLQDIRQFDKNKSVLLREIDIYADSASQKDYNTIIQELNNINPTKIRPLDITF